jgi:CO/xanthine dehydrogenase FAD-binding subunit
MRYLKPKTLDEATKLLKENSTFYLFCGGSDLALKLKNETLKGVIDISALSELDFIKKEDSSLKIGALSTISTILRDENIENYLPLLKSASSEFASHQIRNVATIGGNIANDSPVADMIAPLLVLDTTVTLLSSEGERTIALSELFDGFKSLTLHHEIIVSFNIPLKEHQFYYRKVGSRAKLNISKLSLAMIKSANGFSLSGASLNPYTQRFRNLEELLNSGDFNDTQMLEALHKDISPSGSYRSTKEYRTKVVFNMIKEALSSFENE